MNYKILLVDDEPANLRILERLFRADYKVVTAASGGEALELLSQHDIALIISDQRMPVMTGIDFLKKAAEMRPQTVRIILTGYTDVNALVEAINSGVVYKYVSKPWVNEDLQQTVKRALQHYETIKTQHQLALQNERLRTSLKTATKNFVEILARMLDLKEPNLYSHVRRTDDYAIAIGRRLNLETEELEQLSLAARLHEFAHVFVPNQILSKKTELTEEERQILMSSSERELEMLAGVPDFEDAAASIRFLYEQYDGSGYPENRVGERIPIHARIIAVADAFDAMTFPRNSEPILTPEEAMRELQSSAGKKFDPEIVEIFRQSQSSG